MMHNNCVVSVLSLQSIHVCAAIFCSIEVNYCYIYMYATPITATISVTHEAFELVLGIEQLLENYIFET